MKHTTDRILTAIFCDDIRHEIGNKMSFMGVYQGELIVPAAPIALARLCIYAMALTPVARPFKSLVLRVVLDDKTELARLEIPPETFANWPEIQDDSATRKQISTALSFAPFFIEKPTTLRLMAETEEGEIIGPRLLIKVGPVGMPALVQAAEPEPAVAPTKPKRPRKTRARTGV